MSLRNTGRSTGSEAKLRWVNAQHLKAMADEALAPLVAAQLHGRGVVTDERLARLCGLFKDRCDTTVALAQWAEKFYAEVLPNATELAQHVTAAVRPALAQLADKLAACEWSRVAISAAIKEVLAATGMKMPQLAMPVRVLVMGTAQTPSLDAVLELCDREKVLERLKRA